MVSQRELPDAEARGIVANEVDRTLFVEAGAGTGKTTSLIARIVQMVRTGTPIGRIAAITFTEAAASELRVRVRNALISKGEAANDRALLEAAGEVESAAFTTLHGFALRILTDHPIEAGLPPGFSVADEIGSALQFELAWKDFASRMSDDMANLELFERAAILKIGLRKFPDIARKFDDNWDLLSQVETPKPLSNLDFSKLDAGFNRLTSYVEECSDPDDKLAIKIQEFSSAIEQYRSLEPEDQLSMLTNLAYPPKNVGRKDNWPTTPVSEIRTQIDFVKSQVGQLVETYQQEVIDHMVSLVVGFVEQQVETRRSSGQLSFHDLLVVARKLLRHDSQVRQRLHQRYSKILLDEFQDTDPIQIELAVLLATDHEPIDNQTWPDLASNLQPGRLVVVGDPKQSIYRFRRADIGVYSQAEEVLVESPTKLTTNFRSVPDIVEWVNHMFGSLMGDGNPGIQPAYTSLQPYRNADHATPRAVRTIGGPSDDYLRTIRHEEASDVAAVICTAMTEQWRVERNGQWQPIRLSDIAVLVPSRLSLPALETAFEQARIAYRPETSSLVYSTQEIRDVLSGVSAIIEPTNAVTVVAALRSSLFGIGDDELASWHALGGAWDYRADYESPTFEGHPIREAFGVLHSWHQLRWWRQPADLINKIVRDRRLREQALASSRPRDRWRRYRFLAEQARHFTSTFGGDLYSFVEWVDVQSSDTARVVEPIPPEPDDDSVRVLTIHGSKGLEFPMVIVAGAATQENSGRRQVQALFPPGAAPQVKLGSGKSTKEYSMFSSVEDTLDASERIRLDYVAATRARDLLVISAHHKSKGRTSSGQRTWNCMGEAPSLWRQFVRVGNEQLSADPPAQLRLASGSFEQVRSEWVSEQHAIQELGVGPQRWTASDVASQLGVAAGDTNPTVVSAASTTDYEDSAIDASDHGALLGSAVHDVLSKIDTGDADKTQRLVEAASQRFGVESHAQRVAALVGAATDSDLFVEAGKSRHWRELYVSMPTEGGSLEGYIDLCYSTDSGLVIVDYKTDNLAVSEPSVLVSRYSHQLATYALALEHVSGQTVTDVYLLFLQEDGAIERRIDDLEQLKQDVEALIRPTT